MHHTTILYFDVTPLLSISQLTSSSITLFLSRPPCHWVFNSTSHPIPSYRLPSHPIQFHPIPPIPSHPIPSQPIPSHHITSHHITSHHITSLTHEYTILTPLPRLNSEFITLFTLFPLMIHLSMDI